MEKYDLTSVLSASCGAAPLTGDIQKETCRKLGIPKLGQGIFTALKRSCGKVLFLHPSVILFTGVVHGGEACIAGGMRGGVVCACMAGSMCVGVRGVQERWPLTRAVRILLECILVQGVYTL